MPDLMFSKFVLWISFICETTQNYIVNIFKPIKRRQTSKFRQIFTKHKIIESSAKELTHYWIVCLYSKNVSYYFFITNKFFNFFRNMFNTKTVDRNNLNFCCKMKQSNACLHLHIYQGLLHMPHFFFRQVISWIKSIKSWFILIIPF